MTKKQKSKKPKDAEDNDFQSMNASVKEEPVKVNLEGFDPLSLEGIKGLGDSSLKILKEEGFTNAKQLVATSNPTELAQLLGKDRDEAAEIFGRIKKRLSDAGIINQSFRTATEVLYDVETRHRLPTHCRAIDSLLNGGFESGCLYEIYGEEGAGKTQIVHTLCINAQKDVSEGGFSENGAPVFVYYIETEGTFRPDRIIDILEGKKLITQKPPGIAKKVLEMKPLNAEEKAELDEIQKQQHKEAEKYLDKIISIKARDPYEQLLAIKSFIDMCQVRPDDKDKLPIKLVIFDSIAAPARAQYQGRGNIAAKKDILNEIVTKLKGVAENYKIPVILINQIYNSPTEEFGADPDHAYGGHIVGHTSQVRLKVEIVGGGKNRRLKIIKSAYQANNETKFRITKAGLEDPEVK